jgi:hypothetical protein
MFYKKENLLNASYMLWTIQIIVDSAVFRDSKSRFVPRNCLETNESREICLETLLFISRQFLNVSRHSNLSRDFFSLSRDNAKCHETNNMSRDKVPIYLETLFFSRQIMAMRHVFYVAFVPRPRMIYLKNSKNSEQ